MKCHYLCHLSGSRVTLRVSTSRLTVGKGKAPIECSPCRPLPAGEGGAGPAHSAPCLSAWGPRQGLPLLWDPLRLRILVWKIRIMALTSQDREDSHELMGAEG